ncbi:hypothetical protein EJ03DRAFT_124608 [Teratosphaeria nubilosa]|uniref:Uncharacterized protein n=1 Tax=Teratosphaeria nubilosa TaxID=161662 RepID=A0A6G1LLE7_9PEZI|nr:hypothetical protein EJ03DRAFT_124608 [Teratosphaeria nubilosa]
MATPLEDFTKPAASFHERAQDFGRVLGWLFNIPEGTDFADSTPHIVLGSSEREANRLQMPSVPGLPATSLPLDADWNTEPLASAYPAPLQIAKKPMQQRQGNQAGHIAGPAPAAAVARTSELSEEQRIDAQRSYEIPASAAVAAQSRRQRREKHESREKVTVEDEPCTTAACSHEL